MTQEKIETKNLIADHVLRVEVYLSTKEESRSLDGKIRTKLVRWLENAKRNKIAAGSRSGYYNDENRLNRAFTEIISKHPELNDRLKEGYETSQEQIASDITSINHSVAIGEQDIQEKIDQIPTTRIKLKYLSTDALIEREKLLHLSDLVLKQLVIIESYPVNIDATRLESLKTAVNQLTLLETEYNQLAQAWQIGTIDMTSQLKPIVDSSKGNSGTYNHSDLMGVIKQQKDELKKNKELILSQEPQQNAPLESSVTDGELLRDNSITDPVGTAIKGSDASEIVNELIVKNQLSELDDYIKKLQTEQDKQKAKEAAIALLQEQVRGTNILSRVERGSFTNSSGTDSEDGTLSDVSDAAVVSSVTDGDEMTGGSLADKAYEKIEQLEKDIDALKRTISSENSTPPVKKSPNKKWLSFNRNSSSKDVTLSPDEKKLAEMQLVLSQAYALLDNAIASEETSKVYSTSGTHVNVDYELLLLRNSYEGFQKIIEVIDVLGKSQKPLSSPSQANATMIEQRRGTSGTGQTRLVTNVDNRAALAAGVIETMKMHNEARKDQNPAKGLVTETTIEGADPTSVRFRGVALAREKDIIQYTESLTSGSLIYSETSVNKDGCPVATDRTEIVPAYPSDEWKSDARQAAMIKAENILANYKGTGRIVLRTVQYSGNKEADHERINMEYAAILALSSKSIFSSYPKIVVDIEGFKPPKFSVIGSTANKFIEEHLGKPPHRFTQQANMAQELKALREKDPRVTHGVGINKDGKVVEPEKEKKVERELVNRGVVDSSNLSSDFSSDTLEPLELETGGGLTGNEPLNEIELDTEPARKRRHSI